MKINQNEAIAVKLIEPGLSQVGFFNAMRSQSDLVLLVGGDGGLGELGGDEKILPSDSINSRECVDAIKKKSAKRIAILASDFRLPLELGFRNAEDGIISAAKEDVLRLRLQVARLVAECGITHVSTMLRTKAEGAICIAAAAARIPLTVFLPFLPVKTFAWEKVKELDWTIPRTIVKRCVSIPEMSASDLAVSQLAASTPPVAHVLEVSASVVEATPVLPIRSEPELLVSAPEASVQVTERSRAILKIPAAQENQVITEVAPAAVLDVPAPAEAVKAAPAVAPQSVVESGVVQSPREATSDISTPIIVGQYQAIDKGHPLHDSWILPISMEGKIFQSVTHYMVKAKSEFFSEHIEDDFLANASVLQCLRYLLPDERHSIETKRAWGRERLAAFKRATEAKLEQSKLAREALLATGSNSLVYLSRDRKLGIGFDEVTDNLRILSDRINWKGGNGAAVCLEELRLQIGGQPSDLGAHHARGGQDRSETPVAVKILRKLGPVVTQRAPSMEQLEDEEEDFTEEDLARLSGKIPLRISRF